MGYHIQGIYARRTLRLAALAAVSVCLTGCGSRTIEHSLLGSVARADSAVQAAVDSLVVPGAVLMVSRDGDVVHEKAYGWARLRDFEGRTIENPEPMTVDHVFDMASVTKVMATTLAVMRLVDLGDVDLDAPVSRYVPEFTGAHKDSVTVRLLLLHAGGLSPWRPVYYHARTPSEARAFVASAPLAYPVGGERHYSDLGFMLLGYVVETVAGRPLDDFLSSEIYGPLGLKSTAFNPRSRGLGPFAATSHGNPFERRMVADNDFGYLCDEDPESFTDWREYTLIGEVNDGNAFYAHGGVAGHAGLFSTARDLQVLMEMLLNDGRVGRRQIFSRETVEAFLTPDFDGNGLGWFMSSRILGYEVGDTGAFGHTGFTGTYVLGIPEYGLGVILLTNRQNLGVGPDTRYNNVNPLRRKVAALVIQEMLFEDR